MLLPRRNGGDVTLLGDVVEGSASDSAEVRLRVLELFLFERLKWGIADAGVCSRRSAVASTCSMSRRRVPLLSAISILRFSSSLAFSSFQPAEQSQLIFDLAILFYLVQRGGELAQEVERVLARRSLARSTAYLREAVAGRKRLADSDLACSARWSLHETVGVRRYRERRVHYFLAGQA